MKFKVGDRIKLNDPDARIPGVVVKVLATQYKIKWDDGIEDGNYTKDSIISDQEYYNEQMLKKALGVE